MGAKKKTLANKLAKMSDEERARYLQHKAEMEEEAKRRKEQLIATFMKKKIKKEEAFSRLNLSKINQNWHQLLRKFKVKEMKEEVGHLKRWIERILEYKNRQISKLMEELEEAEEQYLYNFNAHSKHLDQTIESQNQYIDKLQSQYQEELDDLLEHAQKEQESILEHSNSEVEYLKTVIFGQESRSRKEQRESWVYYSIQLYEIGHNNRIKLQHLRRTRGETEMALWHQMLQIIRFYVQRTDVKRCHLQELRRMDAESADEISRNGEQINKEEELVKVLNTNHDDLHQARTNKIIFLEKQEKELKIKFIKVRKSLKVDLALDEKQLRFLVSTSNDTINDLSDMLKKGGHLLHLSSTCGKFVTEREKLTKLLPAIHIKEIDDLSDERVNDDVVRQEEQKKGGLTDDEKISQIVLKREFSLPKLPEKVIAEAFTKKQKPRPKTAIPARVIKSMVITTDSTELASTPETVKIAPIEEVKIEVKKPYEITESLSPFPTKKSSEDGQNFLEECYKSLEKMEAFWVTFNKVNIDVMELRNEKKMLEDENKQLRGIIRAVLEAAALAQKIPDSRISTRAPSQRRIVYSAPLQRMIFN